MADLTLKDIMLYFGMSSSEMMKEWKRLTDKDKEQIRNGLTNGTETY